MALVHLPKTKSQSDENNIHKMVPATVPVTGIGISNNRNV